MKSKVREKEKAISLRKLGYSYKEILEEVAVAKSTLSGWVKDLPLTKHEKLSLRRRKSSNISRGRIKAAATHTANRLTREAEIFECAQEEYREFVKEELFKVGVALYWAEGAKRNKYFSFCNSDVDMMRIMVLWSDRFLGVSTEDVKPQLYIHKPYAHECCEEYWSKQLSLPLDNFNKTIYKPTNRLYKKRPQYKGVLRVSIFKREYLLKMKFWINMMVEEGFKV